MAQTELDETEQNTKNQDLEQGPDALELLTSQHREVEALFKQLEETSDRAYRVRTTIFEEIANKLTYHAKIEEKILYPEGKDVDEDMTLEAYEEHDVMKQMIAKIRRTEGNDETYMAKVTVLKEIVEHHVKEEEEEYFPKIREEFEADFLKELGMEMQIAFNKLEARTQKSTKNLKKAH